MRRILVTGGGGFLGSYVCERHLARGDAVLALDVNDGAKIAHLLDHPDFRFVNGSILDTRLVSECVAGADVVVHLAAVANPETYVNDPLLTMDIDLRGAMLVVEQCAQHGKKLIFTSTSEVYGRNPAVPWSEDDDRVLGAVSINRWCYATSKAAVEHYINALAEARGLRYVIFRPFNVYGPRLDELGAGRVLVMFVQQLLDGKPLVVHGDGSQTRTFCYVDDVAEALVRSVDLPAAEGETINVGSDVEVSILELAHLGQLAGRRDTDVVFISHADVFGPSYEDIPRRLPDISKIRRILGWGPSTELPAGLLRTVTHYRELRAGGKRPTRAAVPDPA